ncbi:MAG: hypothetical protein AVDCRST_MAG96-2885 [uncultured Segetibacter sp.]|uniref:Uncharacterized protein n=1 Tax=uncultured Segetibacter sp. TaxID=481133 RepID=A0A6J4TEU7_9BACT|nr:MAG: hypothetical protein AVDCRST_MAG96-2885 [uncultured Segetibacter sp.]
MYLFELKVSDAGGLFSKDTVQIEVNEGVIAPATDTTFTDLVWLHWHPPGFPDNFWDEIYLAPQMPENFFLNVPDSDIQVFVRTNPSADWIETRSVINPICDPPYEFTQTVSSMAVQACRVDFSLIGKKASVRVVIK